MIALILISLTLITAQLAVLAFSLYVLHGSNPPRDAPPRPVLRKAEQEPKTWVLTDAAMAGLEQQLRKQRADESKPHVPYR